MKHYLKFKFDILKRQEVADFIMDAFKKKMFFFCNVDSEKLELVMDVPDPDSIELLDMAKNFGLQPTEKWTQQR